jgi:beta-glucanase (GH16 family)
VAVLTRSVCATRHARSIAALASAAAIAAGAAVPSLAATHASPVSAAKLQTVIRHTHVSARGTYAVIVSVAPPKANETVDVYVGSQSQRGVRLTPSQGIKLAFWPTVQSSSFAVRVVSHGPKVSFSVASSRQLPQTTPTPGVATTGSTSPTGPSKGPYNSLVWSDEFNGSAGSAPDPTKWSADSGGGCGPGTLSNNTPNVANASVDGAGHLAITDLGPNSNPPYSTAQIDTAGFFSFTYGRVEARIKTPPGQGLCAAFWLLADDGEQVGWPNGGEMDVMEQIGNLPSQTNGFLHGPIQGVGSNYQQFNGPVNSATPLTGGFHTYGLIWQKGSLTWTLDGVPFASATPKTLPATAKWVYDGHPFHIVLDLAVGGWPGNPSSATSFPASMLVDWVHVYQ